MIAGSSVTGGAVAQASAAKLRAYLLQRKKYRANIEARVGKRRSVNDTAPVNFDGGRELPESNPLRRVGCARTLNSEVGASVNS
jgi:hypothetical protein